MKRGTKRFTLDGEVIDILSFITENPDFTKREIRAAEFVLRRVK